MALTATAKLKRLESKHTAPFEDTQPGTFLPIDETAARVVRPAAPEDCYRSSVGFRQPLWRNKPRLINHIRPDMEQLRGLVFGRGMIVVGLYTYGGTAISSKGQRWLVRCPCGNYELRTPKAIKNPKNVRDVCQECARVFSMRNGY